MSAIQPLTPPLLEHVVTTCLAKDRDDRWQSAGDITRELTWIAANQPTGRISEFTIRPVRRSRVVWLLAGALAGTIAGAVTATLVLRSRDASPRGVTRTLVSLSPAERFSGVDPHSGEGRPDRTALLTDFDGTISPIVDDPAAARPLPGAVDALHALPGRYRRVDAPGRDVELTVIGALPPSFDGRVAVYLPLVPSVGRDAN